MTHFNQRNKTLRHHGMTNRSNIARKGHTLYQFLSSNVIVIFYILGFITLIAITHDFDGTIKASATVNGAEFTITRCPVKQ